MASLCGFALGGASGFVSRSDGGTVAVAESALRGRASETGDACWTVSRMSRRCWCFSSCEAAGSGRTRRLGGYVSRVGSASGGHPGRWMESGDVCRSRARRSRLGGEACGSRHRHGGVLVVTWIWKGNGGGGDGSNRDRHVHLCLVHARCVHDL